MFASSLTRKAFKFSIGEPDDGKWMAMIVSPDGIGVLHPPVQLLTKCLIKDKIFSSSTKNNSSKNIISNYYQETIPLL